MISRGWPTPRPADLVAFLYKIVLRNRWIRPPYGVSSSSVCIITIERHRLKSIKVDAKSPLNRAKSTLSSADAPALAPAYTTIRAPVQSYARTACIHVSSSRNDTTDAVRRTQHAMNARPAQRPAVARAAAAAAHPTRQQLARRVAVAHAEDVAPVAGGRASGYCPKVAMRRARCAREMRGRERAKRGAAGREVARGGSPSAARLP